LKDLNILAIESSCDDTCAAILRNDFVLSSVVFSQNDHKNFGGIVPEIASSAHLEKIRQVVTDAIFQSKLEENDINLIVYTKEPGLLGSLLVGKCFAESYSFAKDIPCIGVNHIKGHIFSPFLNKNFFAKFPHLCLSVSGGHTQLILVESFQKFEIIGETLDDAVGEAFDKIGKMLGLEYPAGPLIEKFSEKGFDKFIFSNTIVNDLNYSFSGIKTAFMNFLKKNIDTNKNFIEENLSDICFSIQKKLVDMLIGKLKKSIEIYKDIKAISLVGGVACNSFLKNSIYDIAKKKNLEFYFPEKKFSTDNAAMIGLVGYFEFLNIN
jgi:N6-L-threonylcarbamoyladenine synthase